MSETTDKINKLAKQHEIIGTKTDCPYFSNVGNLCSRVQNGMMRCDEYLECEFKYIDALKEENEKLQEKYEILTNKFLNSEADKYLLQEENKKLKQENMGMKKSFVDIVDNIREENYRYYKALKEIKEIIQTFPNKNSSLDWEAKAHRAIEIIKQINEVLKDE